MATRIIQHIEDDLTSQGKKRGFMLRPILVMLTFVGAIILGFAIGKSGFDRINGYDANKNQIENLKTELYIHDFIDENNTRFSDYRLFTGSYMGVQGWEAMKAECTGTGPGKNESFNSLFLGS